MLNTKKPVFLLVTFFLLRSTSMAQNLVPNPSLEDMFDCPENLSGFSFPSEPAISVSGWSRPSEATSDYFNSCVEPGTSGELVGTPENFVGYQVPKTGEGYAGAACLASNSLFDDYREYLQTQLTTPLVAGHRYFAGYFTSFAEAMWDAVCVDQLGVYFSVGAEERVGEMDVLSDIMPQIKSPVGLLLDDAENWMLVAGTFIAEGGEEWIIAGNFTPMAELNVLPQTDDDDDLGTGYYYFDDFCVLDMEMPSVVTRMDTMLCPGEEILFAGQDGYSNYFWNDETTSQNKTVSATGTYWVASIDAATCICRVDTINVTVELVPLDINLGNDTIVCFNEPIELTAFDEAFSTYSWSTGARSSSISVPYPGTYYVTGSSACYTDSDTIVIDAPGIPNVELPGDTVLCKGAALTVGIAMGNLNYQWNTGHNVCCITVTEPGNYILTATNVCGESENADITVDYSNCDNCILVPTAFSPNGDGLNDEFTIVSDCILGAYRLDIYNRYGQRIFISYDPSDGWDGTFNGSPLEVGVYFYYVQAEHILDKGRMLYQKGDLTLLR